MIACHTTPQDPLLLWKEVVEIRRPGKRRRGRQGSLIWDPCLFFETRVG